MAVMAGGSFSPCQLPSGCCWLLRKARPLSIADCASPAGSCVATGAAWLGTDGSAACSIARGDMTIAAPIAATKTCPCIRFMPAPRRTDCSVPISIPYHREQCYRVGEIIAQVGRSCLPYHGRLARADGAVAEELRDCRFL